MNLIEQLIRIDAEKANEKETKKIKSDRLTKLLGSATEIEIQELNGRKVNNISQMIIDKNGNKDFSKMYDMNLMYCVEGIIEPSLKDAALMEHFHAKTPKDLAAILFSTESGKIANEIARLSGVGADAEEEVKNSSAETEMQA